MQYHYSRMIDLPFETAIERVTQALQREGFGVLTEIDVKTTLKKKLNVDFRDYRILGVCNPHFAHQALLREDKIGIMLPCNVVIQAHPGGRVEVSVVDPQATLAVAGNQELTQIAGEVSEKLRRVVDSL